MFNPNPNSLNHKVAAEPLPKVEVHESFHPDQINASHIDIPACQHARAILEDVWESQTRLNEIRTQPNTNITRDAYLSDYMAKAERVHVELGSKLHKATMAIAESKKDARDALLTAVGLREDDHSSEIRSVLRSMSPQDRDKVIIEAMAKRDKKTLAAAFLGPGIITGLSSAQAAALYDAYAKKEAPDHWQRFQAIDAAKTKLETANNRFPGSMVNYFEDTPAFEKKRRAYKAIKASYEDA